MRAYRATMVTLGMSSPGRTLSLPTWGEMRAMWERPSVVITAILCGTLILVTGLLGIVFLAYNGKGTEAIGALILGVLGFIYGKLRKVEHQTNGITTRALDAALPPPPIREPSDA